MKKDKRKCDIRPTIKHVAKCTNATLVSKDLIDFAQVQRRLKISLELLYGMPYPRKDTTIT